MSFQHLTPRIALFAISCLVILATSCSREAKARRHLERADRYFQSHEYAKAEIEYLNVLRLDSGNPAAIRQLGLAFFEQGRYPQAFAFLQRAKPTDPNNLDIRAKLAFGALVARNLTEAREEALFILSRQATNEEALVLLADAVEGNQIQQTKKVLEGYRAQAAGLAGFHVAMGLVELRANNRNAAEASFKEAVRLNPRSATARATLGNFYLRESRADLAEGELKAAAEVAPPRSLLAMSYADFKIKQGQPEEGKKLLEEIAKKTPDFIPARIRLAELAFSRKDYDTCESVLKNIASRGPANFEAQFLQGRLRLARGDTAGALTEFQRLLTAFPAVPQLHYQLALTHLGNRDAAAASVSLNEALTLDPNYTEAILLAADLNVRKGDYATAVTALSGLVERENSVQARVLLAAVHERRKDCAAALAEYQKLAEAFPKNPQFAFSVGNTYLQQKDTNSARQAFERALSLDKDYLPALERIIGLDLDAARREDAFQKVQGKISEMPGNAPLQLLLAKVLLAQRETNKAEMAMLKAIELNPELLSGYVLLAGLYVSTQRHQEALDRLEAVLVKQTNAIGALMTAAAIQDELKNFPGSRDYYERILAAYPNSPAALNNLAYIYSEHLNRPDRAFELAEKARAVLPRDPAAADTLGWILYKRGEYGRALGLLEESAAMLPEHPEALFHLAMVQYALGQEEPARANFEKSLAPKRDFPGKSEGEQRLAILTMKVEQRDANTTRQLEKLLEERPADPIILGRLARIYEATGEPAKAARLYETQLKQNPNNVTAMMKLAGFYFEHGKNSAKAMDLAKKARSLAPQEPATGHLLGRLAYASGDQKWAVSLLQESARKLPEDPQVALDLARAQFGNGQLREAEASLTKVIALDGPKKLAARESLKWISLCLNPDDVERAAVEIQHALKNDPNHLAARFLSGQLCERKEDFKAAQAAFESILRQFPLFTPAHKELAYLYTEHLADDQKALDHALKAREADRQDPRVAKTLGILAYKRGDFRRSADLLKESVTDRPGDADLHFYLGMVHFRLGDHPQSREALRKALALKATGKFADEAKRTLAQLR